MGLGAEICNENLNGFQTRDVRFPVTVTQETPAKDQYCVGH